MNLTGADAGLGAPAPIKNSKKAGGKSRCIGHYMIGKNIGEGTFGKVKAGIHNVTGEKVSVHSGSKAAQIVAFISRSNRNIHICRPIDKVLT